MHAALMIGKCSRKPLCVAGGYYRYSPDARYSCHGLHFYENIGMPVAEKGRRGSAAGEEVPTRLHSFLQILIPVLPPVTMLATWDTINTCYDRVASPRKTCTYSEPADPSPPVMCVYPKPLIYWGLGQSLFSSFKVGNDRALCIGVTHHM